MWQAVLYIGAFVIGIYTGPTAGDLADQERNAYCEARPQDCSSAPVEIHLYPIFQWQ